MKNSVLFKVLALLFGIMLLAGCQENVPEEVIPSEKYIRITENKNTEYKIVSYIQDKTLVSNLATELLIKTGAKFEIVDEADAGQKAIYIGTAQQLANKGVISSELAYTTYEIKVDNGNIYVAMGMDAVAKEVFTRLNESIIKIEDGVYGIDKNVSGIKNVAEISSIVPEFKTNSGKMLELYESGSGNYEIVYQAMNLTYADQEVAAYEKALQDAGYTLFQENEVNRNRFVTYTNGDTMVHCNYFRNMREFRIIYGPKSYLGSATPINDYEKKVTPSISIVGATDSVLCMVYQAPDGSFVIIDGGYGTDRTYSWTMNDGYDDKMTYTIKRDIDKDMESLWSLLESRAPAGQKPQVTWMMTHGDPDHICLPPLFMKKYQDRFDLNLVVYNFPIIENVGLKNGEGAATYQAYIDTFINSAKKYFPNAPHMVFHTGQKLYLPGTEIEFLIAAEDYWPHTMPWMNDTCAAWRITSAGKTIFITGDCTVSLNNQMVGLYGDYLKSDILQLNHHGSNGGTLSFYKLIRPEVAFWACEDNRFLYDRQRLGTKPGFEFNKYIRETVEHHYSGSYTHTVLLPSLEEEK
ncbi:MAG: hypothetical protein J6A88_06680 [Oscillospiraceae bacterium]|nr:hypothetical protein [Oscillospiraceae bacterium]